MTRAKMWSYISSGALFIIASFLSQASDKALAAAAVLLAGIAGIWYADAGRSDWDDMAG
jgi:hypothetical protein